MTRSSVCGSPSHVVGNCLQRPMSEVERLKAESIKDAARQRYAALLARQELVGWDQLSHELGGF